MLSQHLYINLKAGKHHLNGNQAHFALRRAAASNACLMEQALNTLSRLPKILSVISLIDTNLTEVNGASFWVRIARMYKC